MMVTDDICGEIIHGQFGEIGIRQRSDKTIEIGDLLVQDSNAGSLLLQVYNLEYGSQIADKAREMMAGMTLEGFGTGLDLVEPHLRNYVIAYANEILHLKSGEIPRNPKILPKFFGEVRHAKESDFIFLSKPENPVYFGKIRSGSKILNSDVFLDGQEVFSHHVLIPATTGRGKSNLVKVMLWSVMDKDYCGILVLDPHNEYYGKGTRKGLRDHPLASSWLRFYTSNSQSISGSYGLVINIRSIRPSHLEGIMVFTDAQNQAIWAAFFQFGENWIQNIFIPGLELPGVQPVTIDVLRRKLGAILGMYIDPGDQRIKFRSRVFTNAGAEGTIPDLVRALEEGKKVIIDTSNLEDRAELLVGSIIANEILERYKIEKENAGTLDSKPVISVIIEEAPRVLGDEVLSQGSNIYSDIAREGRKFKIGLVAVTQLTSVIQKTILANLNTKIILGNELREERSAIIQNASQDLSNDDRNIASLDKGEAIISSTFSRFAVPIKIPIFEDYVSEYITKNPSPENRTRRAVVG
jgi:uncharacterized protein